MNVYLGSLYKPFHFLNTPPKKKKSINQSEKQREKHESLLKAATHFQKRSKRKKK